MSLVSIGLFVHPLDIDEPYHFHDGYEEPIDGLHSMFSLVKWFVGVGGFRFYVLD